MALSPFPYSDNNKRYHTFDYAMRQRFGKKTAMVPLDAGLTCPNRDGTKGTGGCIYCSGRGSGDFVKSFPMDVPISQRLFSQFKAGKQPLKHKWGDPYWIAYFQAFTNTYAPLPYLLQCWQTALSFPGVIGLSIATRADCLESETITCLEKLSRSVYVEVQLGLQTIHDSTAQRINRGHSYKDFLTGYHSLKDAGILTGIHLINGLPGETKEQMMESVQAVAELSPYSLKLHLLHVLKGTPLEPLYQSKKLSILEKQEYLSLICDQLEILPPNIVIQRLSGDGPKEQLLAPLWSRNKRDLLNQIDLELVRRDSWQGKNIQ